DAHQNAADDVFCLDPGELRLGVEDDAVRQHWHREFAHIVGGRVGAALRYRPGLDSAGERYGATHADAEHDIAVFAGRVDDVAQILHDRLVDEDLGCEGGHRDDR